MAYIYRYPGENWVFIDGDEYTIDKTNPLQIPGSYEIVYKLVYYEWFWHGTEVTNFREIERFFLGTVIIEPDFVVSGSPKLKVYNYAHHPLDDTLLVHRFGVYIESEDGIFKNVIPNAIQVRAQNVSWFAGAYEDSFEIVSINNLSSTNIPQECTFTVTKNGQVVHNETRDVCPEVITANQCPEGTCTVDCVTHYCCYGSDGTSVHSFEKVLF